VIVITGSGWVWSDDVPYFAEWSSRCSSWGSARLAERFADAPAQFRIEFDTALTHLALTPKASELVLMATAGHRSFATSRQYLHLAGRAFPNAAAALQDQLLAGTQLYPSDVISADPGASDPAPGAQVDTA
jgi:hypothetical protein